MTADEIRALRDRLGMTQTALAYHLGVTVDTVRKYEQGQRSPSSRIAAILSELKGKPDGPAND